MWQKIKNFIFEQEKPETVRVVYLRDLEQLESKAKAAMEHYCEICDIGFTTRGGAKNHLRLRHPEMYVSPTANQELPQTG